MNSFTEFDVLSGLLFTFVDCLWFPCRQERRYCILELINHLCMRVSLSGSLYCEKFVFSVFLGDDIIPRLSVSSAFDAKIRLLTTLHDCDLPKVSLLAICSLLLLCLMND